MTTAAPSHVVVKVDQYAYARVVASLAGLSGPQAVAVLVATLAGTCLTLRGPREAAQELGRMLADAVERKLAQGAS